jgi:hypothetical protein
MKLDCGHSLSPDAIRIHIQDAQKRDGQAVPSCCGTPLPRQLLDVVVQKKNVQLAVDKPLPLPPSETGGAARDSGYCEKDVSSVDLPRITTTIPSQLPTSTILPIQPNRRRHEAISIDTALANEAFMSFRSEEKEQFERVSTFESDQRKALSAHHVSSFKRLAAQHEASRIEKMEQVSIRQHCPAARKLTRVSQHAQDLEHLEEAQITAEHDLRKAQQLETQNVATALKYMEAYCLGSGQSHPDHPHIVSEEDFKKLDRQRMLQQNLPRRQENAINVLRARQERETKNKVQKQEQELDLLDAAHGRERCTEESDHAKEVEKLEAIIEARRKRLLQRWDLRFEIWRRGWEEQHGTSVTFRLEHESFPQQISKTLTPIPETSALAIYVRLAA